MNTELSMKACDKFESGHLCNTSSTCKNLRNQDGSRDLRHSREQFPVEEAGKQLPQCVSAMNPCLADTRFPQNIHTRDEHARSRPRCQLPLDRLPTCEPFTARLITHSWNTNYKRPRRYRGSSDNHFESRAFNKRSLFLASSFLPAFPSPLSAPPFSRASPPDSSSPRLDGP